MAKKPISIAKREDFGQPSTVRHRSISAFLLDERERERIRSGELNKAFTQVEPFLSQKEEDRRAAARTAIESLVLGNLPPTLTEIDRYVLSLSFDASTTSLPGYASLDEGHIRDVSDMAKQIAAYALDMSRKRPLNFLMLAPPGSGKSHLIDCLSKSLQSHRVVGHAFNMATMAATDELSAPLDDVRNSKVVDQLPLLFLDEFDSSPGNFGLLLPLLWDGQVTLRHRKITLGKAVVVLAGSTRLLPQALAQARSMRFETAALEGPNAKLVDLLSRINGAVVTIPPLDALVGVQSRRFDKVAIAVQLLRRRFGQTLRRVPLALLAFIGQTQFRYDVRSISHMIDLIHTPPSGSEKMLTLGQMPIELRTVDELRASSLVYHLIDDVDNAHGVVNRWNQLTKNDALVPIVAPPTLSASSEEEKKLAIAYALSVIDE